MVEYAIECVTATYRPGFQNQQDSLRCIAVRVVLAADLMDDLMAEGDISKNPLLAWPLGAQGSQNIFRLLRHVKVFRVRNTIQHNGPVHVAPGSEFIPR